MDNSWLSGALISALVAQDLLAVEVHAVGANGEPMILLQSAPRRLSSSQPKFALSIGIACQKYLDVCLYNPGFIRLELEHVQMRCAMLWILRSSRSLLSEWSFRDHNELGRLFNEFECCTPNVAADRKELAPPLESTCVEFVRGGISLRYDPYRSCASSGSFRSDQAL